MPALDGQTKSNGPSNHACIRKEDALFKLERSLCPEKHERVLHEQDRDDAREDDEDELNADESYRPLLLRLAKDAQANIREDKSLREVPQRLERDCTD